MGLETVTSEDNITEARKKIIERLNEQEAAGELDQIVVLAVGKKIVENRRMVDVQISVRNDAMEDIINTLAGMQAQLTRKLMHDFVLSTMEKTFAKHMAGANALHMTPPGGEPN